MFQQGKTTVYQELKGQKGEKCYDDMAYTVLFCRVLSKTTLVLNSTSSCFSHIPISCQLITSNLWQLSVISETRNCFTSQEHKRAITCLFILAFKANSLMVFKLSTLFVFLDFTQNNPSIFVPKTKWNGKPSLSSSNNSLKYRTFKRLSMDVGRFNSYTNDHTRKGCEKQKVT